MPLSFAPISGTPISSLSNVFTYQGSGKLTLGNSATVVLAFSPDASGKLVLGESAQVRPTYIYDASGSLILGESCSVKPTYIYNTSGNLLLGESGDVRTNYNYTADGNLILGDSASANIIFSHEASGNLILESSAISYLAFSHEASGNLILGESAQVRPTYIYTGSGSLVLGESSSFVPVLSYQGSGKLLLGENSDVRPVYVYNLSGKVVLSGAALVTTDFIVSYSYTSSGLLFLGETSSAYSVLPYQGSGSLILGSTADSSTILSHEASGKIDVNGSAILHNMSKIGDGKITLGSSAGLAITYIYQASGDLNLFGNVPITRTFTFEASGGLKVRQELVRGFDYKKMSPTGYWDLIEDKINKARQSRSECNDPISNTAFLALLANDKVRENIVKAENWRVVCYLGDGIFDIEIDGVRINVNVYVSNYTEIIPQPDLTPKISSEIKDGESVQPTPKLSNQTVYAGLNNRIKGLLAGTDWFAENGDEGKVIITVNGTTKLTVNLYQNDVQTITPPAVEVNIAPTAPGNFLPEYLNKATVLAGLTNQRVRQMLSSPDVEDWTAEIIDRLVSITITTKSGQKVKVAVNLSESSVENNTPRTITRTVIGSGTRVEELYKISQERVLAMLGNSFLSSMSKEDWEVVGIRDGNVDVKMNNGVLFSVSLTR